MGILQKYFFVGKNIFHVVQNHFHYDFPQDFYKSSFYKEASKDGWEFVDRKNLQTLPKGTKIKVLRKSQIDNANQFNYALFKRTNLNK